MAEILLGGKRLGDLKVTELKSELDKRGLQKKGVKNVLLNRLKNAILREALTQEEETADSGDLDVSQVESTTDLNTSKGEVSNEVSNVDEGDILSGADDSNLIPDHMLIADLSDVPPSQLLDGGSEDMDMSGTEDMNQHCDDHEPIATTPTHEADQGHMSGAEEAPPTSNPTPAVVPSPDDSAKEVTEQDIDVIGDDDDSVLGIRGADNENLHLDEEASEDKSSRDPDSVGPNVTIDPSYNPNGEEELLYEGDMEAEAPVVKDPVASQDEGFMINVHETGMELDMAESLSDSHSKGATADSGKGGKGSGRRSSSSPLWRSGEGGASKTTPSSSSKSDSKRSSSSKDVDRNSLWVSGLVSSVRAMDLQTLFSPFGQVVSAKIVAKSRTKQLRFGFITMATPKEAQRCIDELNGTELKGKKITVELSKSQPPLNKLATVSKTESDSNSNSKSKSGSGERKPSSGSPKTVVVKSGKSSRSIADKVVERSRRSVEMRKVTTSDRDRPDSRRRSAPMPRRSRSRERGPRVGHRVPPPRGRSRSPPPHVSVHHRLGAIPSGRGPAQPEVAVRRDMERDLYLRDRERQERRLEHTRNQEINLRRQMEAERSRRDHEMARRLQEIRERETREREVRERQIAEQERLFREKERELKEREYRERQRREALERELREREAREGQFREREKRIKEMHEKEMRERDLRIVKEREMREREARAQADRERELRERERRLKEEQERIERERRAHDEQERWMREEAARLARVKVEESARREREETARREEVERRERERREKEKQREEEVRAKREREQKREREEMQKRLQQSQSGGGGGGSGRLGKRPYQDSPSGYESKRQAMSDSYDSKRPSMSDGYDNKRSSMSDSYDKRSSLTDSYDNKRSSMSDSYDNKRSSLSDSYDSKRPTMADSYESKRPSLSDSYDNKRGPSMSDSYLSPSSSVFRRLDQKSHSGSPHQGGVGGQVGGLMSGSKDLPHVNPDIINAATQALKNIRKSVPSVPAIQHLPRSSLAGGSSSATSLQAQIHQLAAATALANSGRLGGLGAVGLDYRGGGGMGGAPQLFQGNMLRQPVVGQMGGMLSKSPHGGGGGMGSVTKLPPEDQRYNRRLGGSGGGGRSGGGGGYRMGGGPRQAGYKGRM